MCGDFLFSDLTKLYIFHKISILNDKNMASFKQMDKVLSLVAKTGDKVIVVSEAQEPYVIMTFSEYDRLLLGNSGLIT